MGLFIGGLMLGLVFGAIFQKYESDDERQELERIIHKQSKKIEQLKLILNVSYGANPSAKRINNQDLTKI